MTISEELAQMMLRLEELQADDIGKFAEPNLKAAVYQIQIAQLIFIGAGK